MLKLGVHKTFKGKRLYKEVWKDVVGYEGYYQVSNMGRVRSLDRMVKNPKGKDGYGKRKGKILTVNLESTGYKRVQLCKDGIHKLERIHRLVAMAFIPNLENKLCIDHINTDRSDNRAENLRWVTHKENCNNQTTRKNNKGFRTSRKVMCMETGTIYDTIIEIERQTGILHSDICKCCKGTRITAGGYHWKYVKSN